MYTQEQALKHIAAKMRQKKFFGGPKKSPIDDARDMLANTVLAHVPVVHFNFKMKVIVPDPNLFDGYPTLSFFFNRKFTSKRSN